MQRHFHEKLEAFHTDLLQMASLVEANLKKSFLALKNQDKDLAAEVIQNDQKIDEFEISNEAQAVDLLACYQPMAVDLRRITTAMHVNSDLEMMADLIVNIAQRAVELADQPLLSSLDDIEKLTHIAQKMIRGCSDAFIKRDLDLAKEVIAIDPESNRMRDLIISDLIHEHMVKDGNESPRAVPLLLVARDLERICDFSVTIAQDVIYMIEARIVKHHPERLQDNNE